MKLLTLVCLLALHMEPCKSDFTCISHQDPTIAWMTRVKMLQTIPDSLIHRTTTSADTMWVTNMMITRETLRTDKNQWNFTWVDVPLMRKLKWISCGQISMEQDQRLTTGWKHKSFYSTCASRSRMERCSQVMWMPTTNITPFEMVKQPLLTHLLTNLRSHIKFRNITDFMSCTITIKLIIADIEIKVCSLLTNRLLAIYQFTHDRIVKVP